MHLRSQQVVFSSSFQFLFIDFSDLPFTQDFHFGFPCDCTLGHLNVSGTGVPMLFRRRCCMRLDDRLVAVQAAAARCWNGNTSCDQMLWRIDNYVGFLELRYGVCSTLQVENFVRFNR